MFTTNGQELPASKLPDSLRRVNQVQFDETQKIRAKNVIREMSDEQLLRAVINKAYYAGCYATNNSNALYYQQEAAFWYSELHRRSGF